MMDILTIIIGIGIGLIAGLLGMLRMARNAVTFPILNPLPQPTDINPPDIQEQPIEEPELDMEAIKVFFDQIASVPYDEKNYNCVHKSVEFGNFLLDQGATGVAIVQIPHESQNYSHAFIKWNGMAFDATNTPPYFGVDYNVYLEALSRIGFYGTIISSTYTKGWFDFYMYGKVD